MARKQILVSPDDLATIDTARKSSGENFTEFVIGAALTRAAGKDVALTDDLAKLMRKHGYKRR